MQSIDELRKLYTHFPYLWEQLLRWDEQTWRQFRKDYSVRDLTVRFDLEKEWQAVGLRIRNRDFYKELKERIQHENDQDKAIRAHDQDL